MVKRKYEPQASTWALPGGMVELNEEVVSAAQRELKEETGLETKRTDLEFIDFFDAPDRDPRGRVISFAYGFALQQEVNLKAASDAAEIQWFALDELPELAFDHRTIIARWEER